MTARRDRPSQVRPRPPSTGRPRQLPPATRRPVVPRTVGVRAAEPSRGIPLAARFALLASVVALVAVVLTTVTGVLPRVVEAVGGAFGGLADTVFATPTPAETLIAVPPSPTLLKPANRYTNRPLVTLSGTVATEVAGRTGYTVRIYLGVPDVEPVAVRDVPVGETPSFVVEDLPLEKGQNDVSATVVGPGGESDPSPVVTFVVDTSKPVITITSPANGATVNGATAKIRGKTQARSTLVARNEANGTSASATATSSGSFSLDVTLSAGQNAITLTATDLAGNVGTTVVTVRRGSGKLALSLGASAYRLSVARLPRDLVLRAQVTDPDGRAMAGEVVTFTLSIPGVPAITGEAPTDASGTAVFRATIPAGATVGSGLATAFVSTADHGQTSAQIAVTIVE